jgi:hypothetical protein
MSDYSKQVVSWACGALTKAGWFFDWNGNGWDVETPGGWIVCDDWKALSRVAKQAIRN